MSSDDRPAEARPAFPAETAQARCPRCGASFPAKAVTVVDASRDMDREALLAGRLNVEACPSCGQPLVVEAPLLYFDTAAETALAYLPEAIGASRQQQEAAVGRLTNRALDALPPHQRKMYLLQPRLFFSRQSFMEAVLEANGVSREDMERARDVAAFVETLASIADDEERRRRLADDERADDPALAPIADALAREAEAAGDRARAERLRGVVAAATERSGQETLTLDEIVLALRQARDEDQLAATVAGLRPVLDYAFFAELTRRIDAASPDEAADLAALRADILASIDEHDAVVSAELERATDSLRAILASDDPIEATRRRARALDSAFFSVLQANLRAADNAGREETAEQLRRIREAAYEGLEASMTPRQRLVNRLARAADGQARSRVLDEAGDVLDARTEAALRRASSEASAIGATDIAQRLLDAADEMRARLRHTGAHAP